MRRTNLMVALSLLLQACGMGGGTPSQEELLETWKAELLEADRAFSEAISQDGLALWTSFFTEDGAVIQEGAGEIRGTEAIQATMDAAAGAITSFSWIPKRAEVSKGGDLGYTVGTWQTTALDPDGIEMLRTGVYVSIWRRQEDGSWKVEMDLGNPDSEPTPIPPGAPEEGAVGGCP